MSNYENKTLPQLKKDLKQLQQKKIKKPESADVDQTKHSIQEKINQLKLESAELKWTLDKTNQSVQDLRSKQNDAKSDFDVSKKSLDLLKEQQKLATDRLKANFSRRIKNPERQKKDTINTLRALQNSLITDNLSNAEEKAVIKDIKKQEEYLKVIQKYIEDGGDTLFQERDEKRGAVDNYMKSHNQRFESFDEIRQELTKLYASLDENREEQKLIKDKIGKLQTQKAQCDEKYRNNLKAYRDHTRKVNELRQAVAEKEALESEARENRAHEANKAKAQNRSKDQADQKAEQKTAKEANAEQRKVDLETRRKRAEEEWARVQAEQKRKAQRSQAMSQETEVVQTTKETNKPDPHREERQMCNQLIAMCKAMKANFSPGKRKKSQKKLNKMRLTHKPSVFSNFATAGVAVPTKYGDLDGCVAALEDKIQSFDNKVEEDLEGQDAKDTE